MRHEHMKHVEMKWEHGEEAICVSCGNRNAMLYTGHLDGVQFYECRDCHVIVAVEAQDPNTPGQRFGRIISRSIGKTCSSCHHFVDNSGRGIDYEDGKEKVGYWCDNCGKYWGN